METLLLSSLLLLAPSPVEDLDLAEATIVWRPDGEQIEKFAALELRRYLSEMAGATLPITSGRIPADGVSIAVGSASDPLGAAARGSERLGEEGFIHRVIGRTLVLRGGGPVGTLYAVYDLLERLGMGFYLGGDAYPPAPAPLLVPADLSRESKPAFKIRGSLPWYNFLNSPTTWNREDFKAFFDQMAKQKMNFVGFHTYDFEPFGAYRDDEGKLIAGEPLKTSIDYNWGMASPLKTADFGFGTGRYFDREVFGSHATTDAKDREDAILRAERDLREGLAYARSRGIHVCVGFELHGDPHDAKTQRAFRARFADLLSEYPMTDYVWVWQWEGGGGGSGIPAPGTLARARMEALRPVFAYLGAENRIAEASRMTDYILLAHRILKQLAPEKPLIVSGWGGDRWMRFSDFYLGFDKVLPKDVIFAALDNIDPTAEPNVSHVYGAVSPDRERWPIPWYESDGGGSRRDQWGPQANVKPFTLLLRDALKKGCQGILGIHWRTRGVEEVVAYTAQFAWNPELTYEQFYDGFAERCFGKKHAKEMSAILQELESMGPRWTGTVGQVECGGFQWTSDGKRPDQKKLERLDEINERVWKIGMLGLEPEDVSEKADPVHQDRYLHLCSTTTWLTSYDRAWERWALGGTVEVALTEAARARAEGPEEDARKAALTAWESVRTSGFGDAIRAYAQTLTSQSEFGVLATINVKAVVTYRKLVDRIAEFLPVGPPIEPQYGRREEVPFLSWRAAARADRYRIIGEREDGSTVRIENVVATSVSLPPGFAGQVYVMGIAADGAEGPPSESVALRAGVSPFPLTTARCTPSTSFAAGTSIPVRLAIVATGEVPQPVAGLKLWGSEWKTPVPMSVEFGETYRAEIPVPPAVAGSAPSWVRVDTWSSKPFEILITVLRGSMRVPISVPLFRGGFSATIEPRPFARVWKPIAVTPPVAGQDWPAVVRVDLDGPEGGVTVALAIEGGPEIAAERVPYGSYRAMIPGSSIRDPEIRLAARIRRPGGSDVEEVRSPVWTFRTDVRPPAAPANLRLTSPRRYQALLEWDPAGDDTGAVTYEIAKEGTAAGETAIPHFLDAKVPSGASIAYRVVAIDGAGRRSKPATVGWKAPDWPPPGAPQDLAARDGFGLVTLAWKSVEETVAYRIMRAENEAGPYASVSGDSPIAATEYVDHPPEAGRAYWWRVVAVDPLGKAGEPSKAVTAAARPVPREPILTADFDSPETTGKLEGGARIGPGKKGKGLDLTAGGWTDFPDRIEYDDLVEFTISLWIRPDSLDPMPVFISHGHFTAAGIFLQFLGHGVRTFIGNGRVTDGGQPATGAWQHIAVVRKGDILTTYLDGKVVARARFAPLPVGAHRMPFRIGQYADIAPDFQTRGAIDEVKLWLRPLSEEEIRAERAE